MTLLRDLIRIPESVEEGDFVVRAAEAADLGSYVVTDQLKDSFADALKMVEHALATGRSQAKFLHGSFGSGKSHLWPCCGRSCTTTARSGPCLAWTRSRRTPIGGCPARSYSR